MKNGQQNQFILLPTLDFYFFCAVLILAKRSQQLVVFAFCAHGDTQAV